MADIEVKAGGKVTPSAFRQFEQLGIQSGDVLFKSIIDDPTGAYDRRPAVASFINQKVEELKSQLDTTAGGSIYTGNYAMLPVWPSMNIVDRTRKRLPAISLVGQAAHSYVTYKSNQKTVAGGANTYVEGGALQATTPTYDEYYWDMKRLAAVRQVEGMTKIAMPGYDLLGYQMMGSGVGGTGNFDTGRAANAMELMRVDGMMELNKLRENLFFNGNKTTSGITGDPDGSEYDGIVAQCTENTVATTAALTIDDIEKVDQYIFDDGGVTDVAFCSSSVYRDIKNLLYKDSVRAKAEEQKFFYGYTGVEWAGQSGTFPIIPSMYLSNASGSKAIYLLQIGERNIEHKVLLGPTSEIKASDGDYDKFLVKTYETLVVENKNWCGGVTGIL